MPSKRPFCILGIQQIALGALEKSKLAALWVELLGLPVTGQFTSVSENIIEDIITLGSGVSRVEIDLMQPLDATKKPAVHTKPLNHIGLWVDHLALAVEWLTAHDVRFAPGGIRRGASGYDICFIHPSSNDQFPISGEGVLIELVQAPAEIVQAFQSLEE